MQVKVSNIRLEGYIDSETSIEFENTMLDLLHNGKKNVILDCKDLHYISDSGIGALLSVSKKFRDEKGVLVFYDFPNEIKNILEFLSMDESIIFTRDKDEAVEIISRTGIPQADPINPNDEKFEVSEKTDEIRETDVYPKPEDDLIENEEIIPDLELEENREDDQENFEPTKPDNGREKKVENQISDEKVARNVSSPDNSRDPDLKHRDERNSVGPASERTEKRESLTESPDSFQPEEEVILDQSFVQQNTSTSQNRSHMDNEHATRYQNNPESFHETPMQNYDDDIYDRGEVHQRSTYSTDHDRSSLRPESLSSSPSVNTSLSSSLEEKRANILVECKSCAKLSRVKRPGKYSCPHCSTKFYVDSNLEVFFK